MCYDSHSSDLPLVDPMPKAQSDAPIGIFDSGIGGLSVAQEIVTLLAE